MSASNPLDKHFIRQLTRGAEKAFDSLFMHRHRQVYAYCLRLIKSEEAAEEITQDVFLTIWKKKKQLNPELSLDALLFKITRDLSFNHLKKASRDLSFRRVLKERCCQATSNFTEDQILSAEYNQLANMAINELPPQRRTIFRMRRERDMSYEEIAEQLGISKNTVKVQLVKASKFLREYFTAHTDISLLWVLSLLYWI